MLTSKLKKKVQIVGDDLYVTNLERLKVGFLKQSSNAILIKLNQIGTVTETLEVIKFAQIMVLALLSHIDLEKVKIHLLQIYVLGRIQIKLKQDLLQDRESIQI